MEGRKGGRSGGREWSNQLRKCAIEFPVVFTMHIVIGETLESLPVRQPISLCWDRGDFALCAAQLLMKGSTLSLFLNEAVFPTLYWSDNPFFYNIRSTTCLSVFSETADLAI